MNKRSTYRATNNRHVLTADQYDPDNIRANNRWRNRMCDLCFQRGTVIVNKRLYCKDHAPIAEANR